MTDHIIYIAGVACPYDDVSIAEETEICNSEVEELKKTGAEVTVVGSPATGFRMNDVREAFRKKAETNIVIVDAHGSIENDTHYFVTRKNESSENDCYIWAPHFYQAMAAFSQHKPLNVFVFSCGSGNGCEDAARFLPPGSTTVNFVERGLLYSYSIDANALAVSAYSDENLAERLFINILCHGLNGDNHYEPQLTVSGAGDPIDRIYTLWDITNNEYLCGGMPDDVSLSQATKHLAGYISPQTSTCIAEELRHKAESGYVITVPWGSKLEPVRPFPQDLKGPACAMGYMLNRSRIGAFQSAPPDFYLKPGSNSDTLTLTLT